MGYGRSGLCGDSGISLRPLPAVANSFNMSSQLLQVRTQLARHLHACNRSECCNVDRTQTIVAVLLTLPCFRRMSA